MAPFRDFLIFDVEKVEVCDNSRRREIVVAEHDLRQLGIDFWRQVAIDGNTHGFGSADGITELNFAPFEPVRELQASGDFTRHIRARTVDF